MINTSTPLSSWEWNIVTDELIWDQAMQDLYGLQPLSSPMTAKRWKSFILKADIAKMTALICDKTIHNFETVIAIKLPNQRQVSHQLFGLIKRDPAGKAVHIIGICQEMTVCQLNDVIPVVEAIFDHSSEAIMVTDANMRIIRVNASFTTITGYQATEVIGKCPKIFKSELDKTLFYEEIWDGLGESLHWEGEVWNRRKSGESYPQWGSITAIKDSCGHIKSYLAIFSDISERKRAESYIHYLTDYDVLTGLPNRFLLLRQLDERLPVISQKNEIAALLFLDIDHFKTVINSLGHSVGDKILLEIAALLSNFSYLGDCMTARLGGDEFAILLTDLGDNRHAAVEIVREHALKIRSKLSEPMTISGHNIVITCSIGVVFFPNDADTSEQLFKLADAALHQAKHEGRNQIQFITPDIAQNANRRMILLSALNFALALDEFVLLFQPQYDNAHRLVSAEALLRWEPNGQTMAYPDEFIPLAEENGTIISIGIWIVRSVCQYIKNWLAQGVMAKNQSIAVNISPKQFVQADFVEVISRIVKESGIEPYNLELELTEGLLIKNLDESVAKLEALKARGFRISIDDFGTGYSSLAYLKRFPLDTLKIDRSFVTAVDTDNSNNGIVQAIIAMAKALKFDTVAEGVETQAEFDFLTSQQCDLYQGYFFSKPLVFKDFDLLLKSEHRRLQ
jgi:diguanylate cyclase (GGDEF)-like protein/PAS domain S-box-containing protein